MKSIGIAAFSLILCTGTATNSPAIEWLTLGQLCGSLELQEPTKKVIKTKAGKWETRLYDTPLRNARIRLYRARDNQAECCEKAEFVAKTTSGIYGEFKFRNQPAGNYWLVIELRGQQVRVPVIVSEYDREFCDSRSTDRIVTVDSLPPRVEIHIR